MQLTVACPPSCCDHLHCCLGTETQCAYTGADPSRANCGSAANLEPSKLAWVSTSQRQHVSSQRMRSGHSQPPYSSSAIGFGLSKSQIPLKGPAMAGCRIEALCRCTIAHFFEQHLKHISAHHAACTGDKHRPHKYRTPTSPYGASDTQQDSTHKRLQPASHSSIHVTAPITGSHRRPQLPC